MLHENSQLHSRFTQLEQSELYQTYHKPDNKILYIHKDSNHTPSILRQIPTSNEKIISTISSKESFVICFNPPFSDNVKNKIWKFFSESYKKVLSPKS